MRIILPILTIVFLLFGVRPISAVTVTISNIPASISDQPFNIDVSVSGASAATNYLRVNFFPAGTTHYFGYTYNGTDYVNSSDYSQYLPITIDSSGNWSGTIQAKLDTSSSYYSDPSTYSLKVRRYTQSGSSYIWSNELSTTVNLSTPSPSPTADPTPSPTPSSTQPSTSFTISNIPSQVDSNQSFNVTINLSLPANPSTTFYLKGAFKKADSSNYFGQTKVSGSWVKNNGSYSSQYQINTDSSGNWTGNLEVQPDSSDSGFTGTGDYIFKVGRYTSSGSGPSWSNEAIIKIIAVENLQAKTLEKTTSPTIPSSGSPLAKTGIISSTKSKSNGKLKYRIASVAAAATEASLDKPAKVNVKNQKQTNPFFWAGLIFVFTGAASIGYIYLKKNGKIHF